MNKQLILLRGLPGAGKTSLAEFITEGINSTIRAADDYFYENGPTDGYDFDPTKLGVAHKECVNRVKDDMKEGVDMIVVTNTFTKAKDMKKYIELADKFDYRFSSIIVENRHGNKSVHGVPDSTMDKMEKELLNNLKFK